MINPKLIDELIKHRDRKVAKYYLVVDMVQKHELKELIEAYDKLLAMLTRKEKTDVDKYE